MAGHGFNELDDFIDSVYIRDCSIFNSGTNFAYMIADFWCGHFCSPIGLFPEAPPLK